MSLSCLLFPPLLIGRLRSGNTSDGDAQLWRSPPGVACKPISPTPAVMRTHGTRWARGRGNTLPLVDKRKDLDVLPAPVGYPGAAKRSTCHIDPAHRPEQDWLALHHCRRGQETADGTDATSASAFGSWSKTLLTQNTWQTIRLVG
jgi:poly(3-hydroxybutyrate) depolymerase